MKTTAFGHAGASGFREFLQCELARRCAENPQYSLRAFAKSLRTDHATLSQILRGKRRLTAATIRAISHQISLSQEDTQQFVAYEERFGGDATSELHIRQLEAEAVEVITQWHHFAILELTNLECFRPDSRWIARVLDIATDDVNIAVTRLLHLGLLRMVDRKTWVDCSQHALAQGSHVPAAAARDLTVRLARITRSGCGVDRVLNASTMAVDRARLPVVARYLQKVRDDLAALLNSQDSICDDVYQLEILFYPLTNLHQEKDNGSTGDTVSDSCERSRPSL